MQYQYTEDQQAFKSSLARFVQEHYDYEARRHFVKEPLGYSKVRWSQLAELGVLGLPFAEQYGGLLTDIGYLMLVAEEFGRGLVVEPFIPSVVLAGQLIARSQNTLVKEHWLPELVSGNAVLAFAWEERSSRGDPRRCTTTLSSNGDGFSLNGEKLAVLAGPQADAILVTATDEAGQLQVVLVHTNDPGVKCISYPTVDGARAATVAFSNVALASDRLLFSVGASSGKDAVVEVLNEALVVLAAEAVGAMDKLFELTVEYCGTRKQFGQPIAAFQSLQHRIADMYIAKERTRSLMWAACQQIGSDALGRQVAILKAEVCASGRYVGQQAVQLHGGIGMTDELSVGAYFKRLTAIELLFGGRDYHLQQLVA